VVVELLCEKPHVLWWGGPDTGVARLLVKHVSIEAHSLVSALPDESLPRYPLQAPIRDAMR
jgi:hypothetical protein